MIDLKQKESSNKAFLEKRLKDKDKELEAIKQQLERELAEAKKEAELVKERFEMTKNEELKKELEKEIDDKVEQLQQKDIKIKRLEEQLSEKEKYIFDMEASIAADQKEKERLSKEKERESDKNIAGTTRHIDELEQKHQKQLQELKEENEQLRVSNCVIIMTLIIHFNQQITVLQQEKLTRELNEKDTELKEQHIKVAKLEEEIERIRIEEGEKRAELENMNAQRRELEKENQRKMDKLTSELQEKMKARYSDRLKEWQVL